MNKIIEAERRAAEQVAEARAFKTTLLNQTQKKATEKAASLLSDADNIRKKCEVKTTLALEKIEQEAAEAISRSESEINAKVQMKKAKAIVKLIDEVRNSDRPR
jgi:N12 class adenine-specific DNA methylase